MKQITEKTHCYIFIRVDLPLSQQIVQSCHAALELGLNDKNSYKEPSSIVLIQIPNQESLLRELEKFKSLGLNCVSFYEPYQDTGVTSFATIVTEENKQLFKKYTLWGRKVKTSVIKELIKESEMVSL